MNSRPFLQFIGFVSLVSSLHSQIAYTGPVVGPVPVVIPVPTPTVTGDLDATATVVLRRTFGADQSTSPQLPLWVQSGFTVRLQLGTWAASTATIEWFHDGQLLSATTPVLALAKFGPADAGVYVARVKDGDAAAVISEAIAVRLGPPRLQSFLSLSTRVSITPTQSNVICGFAVGDQRTNGVNSIRTVIRAVGPGLAPFGVTDPLAAPQFRLFRSDGTDVTGAYLVAVASFGMTPDEAVRQLAVRAGAFPLPQNSQDVVRLYSLPPGAYTAVLYSADGGNGTALLEVYEVP